MVFDQKAIAVKLETTKAAAIPILFFKPLTCSFFIKKNRKTKGKYATLLSDIMSEVRNISKT